MLTLVVVQLFAMLQAFGLAWLVLAEEKCARAPQPVNLSALEKRLSLSYTHPALVQRHEETFCRQRR
jgi:hypothetical protein